MRLPTALCLLFTTAIAAPVPPKQEVLHNEKTTCATIDTYTVQYFIDNVVPTKRPPSSTCLFYTWGLTEKARLYAQTHGKTTIWVSPTHLPASTPLIPPPNINNPRISGPTPSTKTPPPTPTPSTASCEATPTKEPTSPTCPRHSPPSATSTPSSWTRTSRLARRVLSTW